LAIKLPANLSLGPFTGLRARIVLIIAAMTALLAMLLGFVQMKIVEQNLLRQKRNQGRFTLLAMQINFDLAYLPGDRQRGNPGLSNLIKAMVRNLEVRSLVIVDREQNVIGHNRSDMLGMVLAEDDLQRAMAEQKLIYRTVGRQSQSPEMIFYGPLYRGGEVVAATRFSLYLDDVVTALAGTQRLLWLYALLDAVVVILFGSFVLMRVLVRPVESMVTATERMATGDYRVSLPTDAGGEVGRLGRALSMLASTLRDRDAVVKRQMTRLENINTELKQAHDQLVQSDRLAYVGRVAAGIAHEVGNPLGAIYGYLEILRESKIAEDDVEVVKRIEAEITRIDRIMRELLDFSRSKASEFQMVDLLEETKKAVSLMKSQRGLDRIDVQIDKDEHVPPVKLDAAQFRQVLLNLLLNAADAMSGEGTIAIQADVAEYSRAELLEAWLSGAPAEREVPFTDALRRGIVFSEWIGPEEGTPTVRLHLTDRGPGMSTEVLEHVLDPFFTTKLHGKGTGLGLAICQRLVASAKGLMRIESRPGVGTRVSLIYPVAREDDGDA